MDWKPLQSSDLVNLEVRAIILLDIAFFLGAFKPIPSAFIIRINHSLSVTVKARESAIIQSIRASSKVGIK